MKNIFILFYILFLFQNCSKKEEVLESFGKAKIGMSINDFFSEIVITETDNYYSLAKEKTFKHKFSSIKVSENITLYNTTVEFEDGILKNIEVENNPQLFEQLKTKFTIKKSEKFGENYILEFNTNNEKTNCGVIGNGEKQIISLSESHFKGE